MISRQVTFDDLEGNPITKDFYFNLTKLEIQRLDLKYEDFTAIDEDGSIIRGVKAVIRDIGVNPKGKKILDFIETFVKASYGERVDEVHFDKSERALNDFIYSDAYSSFVMDLGTHADKLTDFLNGIIPKKLIEEAKKAMEENKKLAASK